jgi:Ca2+-binding RTX toxin-like protein
MRDSVQVFVIALGVLLVAACGPAPHSQLGSDEITLGGEGGIFYDSVLRRITIIGASGVENNAVVSLNPAVSVQGGAQNVVVSLKTGGAAGGKQFDETYPLTTAFEATPQIPVPDAIPEPFIPKIIQHVEEIVFLGSSQADRFENNTHIPSEATGSAGDDTLIGGSGDDRLFGDAGNDRLEGHNGNDKLYAGPGADRLFGGNGNDRLVAAGATGNDSNLNRLCGGDGIDELQADPLDINELAAAFGNGAADDGDEDTLIGGGQTSYEFTPVQDSILEGGAELSPGSFDFPTSTFIACG